MKLEKHNRNSRVILAISGDFQILLLCKMPLNMGICEIRKGFPSMFKFNCGTTGGWPNRFWTAKLSFRAKRVIFCLNLYLCSKKFWLSNFMFTPKNKFPLSRNFSYVVIYIVNWRKVVIDFLELTQNCSIKTFWNINTNSNKILLALL